MKGVFGFLGRRGVVFVLFVLALLAYQNRGIVLALRHPTAESDLRQMVHELDGARAAAEHEIAAARDQVRGKTIGELQQQLEAARKELAEREQRRQQNASRYIVKAANPSFALSNGKLALKVQVAQAKVDGLSAVLSAAQGQIADLKAAKRKTDEASDACRTATQNSVAFNAQPWALRAWADTMQRQIAKLDRAKKAACGDYQRRLAHYVQLKRALAVAQQSRANIGAWVQKDIPDAAAELRRYAEHQELAAQNSLRTQVGRFWRHNHMNAILIASAWLLIWSMLTPYLIRTFFYFVLAPLAERRRALRLNVPGASDVPIPPSVPSTTSVQVRIRADEELLVRQGFLQTTSIGGLKRTRALLDWRHPMASCLTGLAGLTSIRGEDQVTTVSAIHDPFSEVTELVIPAGGALVLLPRALVAVVQPIGRPMRISAHWRLFSLHAWLTLQFRYFVFHGPVRLVIRGGRGVRLERARRGSVFAQDQLVGFSTDLAYSVARAETFIPYLVGRESLLKDQVGEGEGVLVIEEAPLSLRGRVEAKHGLEGAFDAALKVVGL